VKVEHTVDRKRLRELVVGFHAQSVSCAPNPAPTRRGARSLLRVTPFDLG
jgi:hypothetical protein